MVRISVMLIFLALVLFFGSGICERLHFDSGLENSRWFREGITLELYCRHDTFNDVEISSPTETIVQGSHLLPGMAHRYAFHKNSTFSVVVIKQISRRDQGIYTCQERSKRYFAVIRILYSPSGKSPQCSSNYESTAIYDDMRQDYINFTCTTDEGNPPVFMTLTVHDSDQVGIITDIAKRCAVNQNYVNSRSLSCHMNESLDNTTFLCDVIQHFPSPYNGSYQGSCSFGPLHFLSNFSITIKEANVTVREGKDVNLTCTTNVTGVKIMWSGIPVDWEYHVTTSDYFSHVWMKHVKQQSPSQITVQCIGAYGNRNVTDSVKIIIKDKNRAQTGRPMPILIILLPLVMLSITFLLGCYAWKQGIHCSLRNQLTLDHEEPQNNEVNTIDMDATPKAQNKNNANNTLIEECNGDETSNSDPSCGQLEDMMVSDMCINPVYESASIVAGATVFECSVDQYAVINKQDSKFSI